MPLVASSKAAFSLHTGFILHNNDDTRNELIENVKAKTICSDFDVQLTVSEQLYGENLKFNFTKNDVEEVIGNAGGYSKEEKERVNEEDIDIIVLDSISDVDTVL